MRIATTAIPLKRTTVAAIGSALAGAVAAAGTIYTLTHGADLKMLAVHGAVGTISLVLYVTTRTQAPLDELTASARRVADGDLSVRLHLGSRKDLAELSNAFNTMVETIQHRTDDLTRKVDEVTTLYEVSRALSSTLDLDALLDSTLDAALRSFGVDSGYLVLRDHTTSELRLRASRGVAVNAPDARAVRASMSEWVVGQGRPLIFNPPHKPSDMANVDSLTGALAAVCVPLQSSEGVIGAIAVGSRDPDVRFRSDDVRLLSTIANHLAIAIGNTELFESLQDAYLATVRSLAAAVDAKEPHMRGHSERVAVFARATAEKMGLSHDQRTALEMASYLHDIGKIGISGHILRKQGRLTPEEVAVMRHHPLIGANILRPVAFPWPIAPVVRHHHERYDGTGYPAGLRGEEIPLLARVLAVTDAYEAMIADRPYRSGFSEECAVAELRECAGTQFDPTVVEALVQVLADEHETSEHVSIEEPSPDPYEARAVCVAVVDGMLGAYRRLGGPRLAGDLETQMGRWLAANEPAFTIRSAHLEADWDLAGRGEDEIRAMRRIIGRISEDMGVVTGANLVDHFYREAVGGLTERLRRSAEFLELYRCS